MSPHYTSLEKQNFMASFALQLKHARRVLDISQSELAAEIKVSPSSVRQWEAEENLPGLLAYRRAKAVIERLSDRRGSALLPIHL